VNEQPRRLEDATILAMLTPAGEKLGTGPSAIEREPGWGGTVFEAGGADHLIRRFRLL
jgi:hypothetical protein